MTHGTAIRRDRARGAIFDLDDTLYAHEDFVRSGFEALASFVDARFGVPASHALDTLHEARQRSAHGGELQALCAQHGLPAALVPQLRDVFRAHRPRLELPAASLDALRALVAAGWRLAVLTNGIPAIQRNKVAALGVASLVHHVVYAEEHTRGGKPAPRPFRVTLARLGVDATRCVMVGDDPRNDVCGARALGIRTIRVLRSGAQAPVPEANAVVADLAGVAHILDAVLEAAVSHAA